MFQRDAPVSLCHIEERGYGVEGSHGRIRTGPRRKLNNRKIRAIVTRQNTRFSARPNTQDAYEELVMS